MPRFSSAGDAAVWGESEVDGVAAPQPKRANAEASPPPSANLSTPAVLALLNQIQVLTETLCETRLDAMQQELVGFLGDAGVLLRREILGKSRPAPAPRPNIDDELDIEEVELIDDLSPPIETSAALQDYLDFEFDDDLYIEPDEFTAASAEESDAKSREQEPDLLDDLEILDNDDAPAAQSPPPAAGPLDQLRILVADDNSAQQMATRVLLESLGASCNACNSAAAAELARVAGWDAILIDVHAHTREGIAAIRAIRTDEAAAQKRRTPIFITAAHIRSDQIREYLVAGADGYVPKPLSKAAVTDQFEVLALERRWELRA